MQVKHFSEIEAEFSQRVRTIVWCNVASVDSQGRPRSRILHPIWEGSTGWIGTSPTSLKAKHLVRNPFVSLAYITSVMNPVYVDCKAEWMDDMEVKRHVWNLFASTPEPIGYDPAIDFVAPNSDKWGVLKLTPWRIDLVSFPAPSFEEGTRIWRQEVK
jgi:hypothetical protein